jgi:hypothetical protein
MPKEIYIFKGLPSENYDGFGKRIRTFSTDLLEEYDLETLKVNLTLKAPPGISMIPFKRKKIAVLSLTRGSGESLDLATQTEGFIGGYVVEEAIPVAYNKTWADGETTPGECLLTLFHSKPGIDRETFLRRWFEGHTPLSLKLHPLWNYNRNVVSDSLTKESIWYDGIVEEQFQKASDLLNPLVFFGPPLKVPLHMYQVLMDTRSFIDMKKIETFLTTEIHLKS